MIISAFKFIKMDDDQESSRKWLYDCFENLNKLDIFLTIWHFMDLAIFISLICGVLNLSYLSFYTKIFVFLSLAIVIICLSFSILHIYWRVNNTLQTRKKNSNKNYICTKISFNPMSYNMCLKFSFS